MHLTADYLKWFAVKKEIISCESKTVPAGLTRQAGYGQEH
jgi:hypothetical protein